jgi:hypothetical protein
MTRVVVVLCALAAVWVPTAAADPLQSLAAKYAPVVRLSEQEVPCGRGEAFDPIDVKAIFDNDEVALRGPWTAANLVQVGPSMADVSNGRDGYALDFPGDPLTSSACSYEQWERRSTMGRSPTVYAHVAAEDGKLALQYWFFYVFNDFNNKHEGDWELIQLNFDAPTVDAALRTQPYEVGYSQHEGAERAGWGSSKLELERGTHPVVYPAEGSHANYYSGALFLGASAQEGVGCDDTNPPWREIDPVVAVIPQSPEAARAAYPWLGYHGRWGEQRRAFFDAPTGPNMRARWVAPISWANATWGEKGLALAGGRSLGPSATSFFCSGIGAGSRALIFVTSQPTASLVLVGALIALLIWAATRTQWGLASLIARAARTYRRNIGLFVSVGVIFLVLGLLVALLQLLVFRHTGVSSLVGIFGESNAFTATFVLGLGLVVNLLGLSIVQATCAAAIAELSAGRKATAAAAYRATWRRLGPLLGGLVIAALAIAVAQLTVIGIPVAIWLGIRWSLLAQSVALDDASATGALGRSNRLVRGNWWRTASLTVLVTGIALALGPLVGTLLLFATDASFDFVNLASDLVYVVALPFAAIATTYLYFDLAVSSSGEGERARP